MKTPTSVGVFVFGASRADLVLPGTALTELPNQKWTAALLGATRESIARATAILESTGLLLRRDRGVYEIAPEAILAQLRSVARSAPLSTRETAH